MWCLVIVQGVEIPADAKTLNGITGPMGFFDPLSMSAQTTPEEVKRYREAELTHGRVCMLAAVGFLAGEAVENIPLFMNWEGNINGEASSSQHACLSSNM